MEKLKLLKKILFNPKSFIVYVSIPFLVLSTIFFLLGKSDLKDYRNTLIGLNVTIAIFAINFSFVEYQFSPYRILIKSSGRIHRWFSIVLLLISLLPLLFTIYETNYLGRVALTLLPITAYGSVLLGILVSRECRGKTLLEKCISSKKFKSYLKLFISDLDKEIYNEKQIKMKNIKETPMHELTSNTLYPFISDDDPIEFAISLAYTALLNNDLITFNAVIEKLLSLYSEIRNFRILSTLSEDYEIRSWLNNYITQGFERIFRFAIANDKSLSFLVKIQEQFALYIRNESKNQKQTDKIVTDIFKMMTYLSQYFLEKDLYGPALISINIARQVTQEGIDNPKKDKSDGKNDLQFEYNLQIYPIMIKNIGSKAISLKNNNFLYRCLDTLGWLGCSAVKKKQYYITKGCLASLTQLGRESRSVGLRCFDTHCGLRPEDHVQERLDWIRSWIISTKESNGEYFAFDELIEAYQRLLGFEIEVSFEKIKEQERMSLTITKNPHIFTMKVDGITRTIDYSDNQVTDEIELYPSGSMIRKTVM